MRKLLAIVLSSLLVATPAFADRTVYAPVRLAPTATAGTILFGESVSAASPAISFSADPDTGIYRVGGNRLGFSTGGAGRVFIDDLGWLFVGNAISSPSPTTGNISGTLGSGTNIAGGDLRINGGQSTGSGAGGSIIFRTTAAGASGSSSNGATERMRITSDGEIGIGSSTATGNRLALTYTTASGVAKIGPNSTGGNTSLAFGTSASGTYADRMTITSAGEILAGTSTAQTGSRYVFDGLTNNFRIQGDTEARLLLEDKGVADASKPFQYLQSDGGSLILGNADRSGTGTSGSTARMTITSTGQIQVSDGTAAAPVLSFSADTDTGVYRPGTNILAFSTNGVGKMTITATGEVVVGQGHNGGSPVAGSIIGAAVAAGTSNTAGVNLTIAGGNSTGTGAGGALIFQTAAAGSSGSAANTLTERMRITSAGTVYFGNGDFSATPAASTLRGTNGQGTDIAGAELVIQAGAGTGNAASGAVTFRTATAGASGTGTNSSSDRMRVKTNGQVRFVPLAADPAGAEAGDVYYNSGTNKLKVYNGTAWVDLH